MLAKHGINCDPNVPEKRIARERDLKSIFSE
jgi:hypothetical protein